MNEYEKMIEVLCNRQLDLQINFFKALLAEKDLTLLPNLS
jgi:hypothetical protein